MAREKILQRGAIRIDIEGLDKLKAKLDGLPKKIETSVVRKTLRTGAAFFRRRIRDNARGLRLNANARRVLSKNVLIRVDRTRSGNLIARVMIKKPNRRSNVKQDAFFWRWVEYGTILRFREEVEIGGAKFGTLTRYRKKVADGARGFTGRIQPQPFVRPAIRDGQREAVDAMLKVAEAEIAKVLAKEGLGK